MLQTKNISAKQLAILVAFILATVVALVILFFTKEIKLTITLFVLLLVVAYFLVHTVLEKFIHRKIKLIYKFISQTKATKREEFYNQEILPPKTLEDVTHDVLKWSDERKQEIEQLESNVAFRKEFLMNLAHELKTPIFATQGYIETLLDGALNDKNVNETFLRNASLSIERLVNLVEDIDTISNLESNQIPLQQTTFIMQDLLKELFNELAFKTKEKNILLAIKLGCEKNILVKADKQKIKQVLINLLDNSIKYGKENGKTTAGIYEVDDKTIFIEITDNGIGIAEEQVPRVFERFYRTDSARSRKVGGSGLGLAIVKHIIEAHGQTVSCRSKLDVGTSFGFTLSKA
jgi:two-component system phosphate regulon sensor histidine kinase PhoR